MSAVAGNTNGLDGYPVIAALADDAKAKEEAAKKEAKRDSSRE